MATPFLFSEPTLSSLGCEGQRKEISRNLYLNVCFQEALLQSVENSSFVPIFFLLGLPQAYF